MTEKNLAEITIHDVDPLALTLLVNFSYTGELSVCEDNVQVENKEIFLDNILSFFLNRVLLLENQYCFYFCRLFCPPPLSSRWARWGRRAASSSCVSCTPPTASASETLRTLMPARSYTSARISLPLKTFKKWWTPRNFFCCHFKR